jgi:two-component system NtrC family response regulator/two-component system nitrogen regulation response regulator GlnG
MQNSSAVRVLVVDDEPLVRWSIAETLRADGYDVVEASDAKAAVRAATEASPTPSLVVLDLRLPDCADLGLLGTIRRLVPDARVVVMTAFGTPEVAADACRLGAFTVLDKPFDLGDLERVLARALAAPPTA